MEKNVLVKKLISTSAQKSKENQVNSTESVSPKTKTTAPKLGSSTPKVSNNLLKTGKNILGKTGNYSAKKPVQSNAPVIKPKLTSTKAVGENKKSGNSAVIPDKSMSAHKRTKTISNVNMIKIDADKRQSFVLPQTDYLRTEPLTSKNIISQNQILQNNPFHNTNKEITLNGREDEVISCLTNSLKILDKIQKDFENSAKNNSNNIDEKRQNLKEHGTSVVNNLPKLDSESVSLIPTKELSNLSLSANKINSKFAYLQVINISDTEKKLVSQNIAENSDGRIKNYSNLFNIINITLEDIKDSIKQINEANERRNMELIEMKDRIQKRYSFISPEVRNMKNDFGFNDNFETINHVNDAEVEMLKENLYNPVPTLPEESCNFSEATMLEHAIIAPPKIENRCSFVNVKTQEIQSSNIKPPVRKPPNETIHEELLDDTQRLEDNTIIEYESLLTEEINFKKENENPHFFIQAKDNLGYEKKPSYHLAEKPYKSSMKNSVIHTNITTAHSTDHTNFTTLNKNTMGNIPSTPKYENTSNSANLEEKKSDKCIIF